MQNTATGRGIILPTREGPFWTKNIDFLGPSELCQDYSLCVHRGMFLSNMLHTHRESWTITERLQLESRRTCIFCCGGEDALHHYLRCDPLCSCIVHFLGLPNECIDRSPAQRLGIVDVSLSSLLEIVIACRVYRSMNGRLGG